MIAFIFYGNVSTVPTGGIRYYSRGAIFLSTGPHVYATTIDPVNSTFAIIGSFIKTDFINLVDAKVFTTHVLLAGVLFHVEPGHVFLHQ
jgi:hypothetical protein